MPSTFTAPFLARVLCASLLFPLVASLPGGTCRVAVSERQDCFPWDLATPNLCAARNCCWQEVEGAPYCYHEAVSPPLSSETCASVPLALRLDCHPEPGVTPAKCASRGCCWTPVPGEEIAKGGNAPWCHHGPPAGWYSTHRVDTMPWGMALTVERSGGGGPFGQDPATLQADVHYYASDALRVCIKSPEDEPPRWEVPEPVGHHVPTLESHPEAPPSRSYLVEPSRTPQRFGLRVSRSESGRSVLDTLGSNLLFEPQLLQFSTALPLGSLVHGLGEQVGPWELSQQVNGSALGRTYTIWTRDRGTPDAGPNGNANLYGAHPMVLLQDPRDGGKASGLFLRSAAAMDVTLHPSTHPQAPPGQLMLTYRVSGGIIDLFVFLGPTPEDVLRQYHAVIGLPALPPRWGLGFHVCRWGYSSLDDVEAVRQSIVKADIPVDTFWMDIDYMDKYRDFTLSSSFPQESVRSWVDTLHSVGHHFVIINDPGIASGYPPGEYPPYDTGMEQGVFIQASDGEGVAKGSVWPGETAFADFTMSTTEPWWKQWVSYFHDAIGFDGLWLDMGEISNFRDSYGEAVERRKANPSPSPEFNPPLPATENEEEWRASFVALKPEETSAHMDYTWPPFLPGRRGGATMLEEKTLPTASITGWGRQYFTHSLFGILEAASTSRVLEDITGGKRSFIISRSTFPGSGVHGGHWLGDNTATWHDLRASIAGVYAFNVFGQPFVGTDLCGFAPSGASVGGNLGQGEEGKVDASTGLDGELCTRWYQAGALMYTFFRVHTMIGRPHQHPTAFSVEGGFMGPMRDAIRLRYTLIPYLYTALARSSKVGGGVVVPLAFHFLAAAIARGGVKSGGGNSKDALTLATLEEEGMVGGALLAAPVLHSGVTKHRVFLPRWERWYEWESGVEVWKEGERGEEREVGSWVSMPVTLASLPLFVRGGWVVPHTVQPGSTTSTPGVFNQLSLTIPLCGQGGEGGAERGWGGAAESGNCPLAGELFWDDGESGGGVAQAGGGTVWPTAQWFEFKGGAEGGGSAGWGYLVVSLVEGEDTVVEANNAQHPLPCLSSFRVLGVDGGRQPHCSGHFKTREDGGGTITTDISTCETLGEEGGGVVRLHLPMCIPLHLVVEVAWKFDTRDDL